MGDKKRTKKPVSLKGSEHLVELRQERKWTQKEACKQISIFLKEEYDNDASIRSRRSKFIPLSVSTLARWEKGEVAIPETKIRSVAKAFSVLPDYLRGGQYRTEVEQREAENDEVIKILQKKLEDRNRACLTLTSLALLDKQQLPSGFNEDGEMFFSFRGHTYYVKEVDTSLIPSLTEYLQFLIEKNAYRIDANRTH